MPRDATAYAHGAQTGDQLMAQPPARSARVSSLELFFDLVFVFTITQLTAVLAAGANFTATAHVVLLLLVIWWMYDGYAWLTNAIETERIRYRLLLMGGMGAFLVMALAARDAFGGRGFAFGLAYLTVVLLHSSMFVQGTSLSEIRAIVKLAAFNVLGAGLVLAGGAVGGSVQWATWAAAAFLFWAVTPWLTTVEGYLVSPLHFVERHGLVVIVALGESVVVIGVGAAGLELDAGLVLVALLALALSSSLWWTYFSDQSDVEQAMVEAPPRRRNDLALVAFGYWHYGLLLGIVSVAAGLKKAMGAPYDPSEGWIAAELAGGVALFLACHAGFRRTLGIARGEIRLAAALFSVLTILLGTDIAAVAQVGALAAIVAGALALDGSRAHAFARSLGASAFRRRGARGGQELLAHNRSQEKRSTTPAFVASPLTIPPGGRVSQGFHGAIRFVAAGVIRDGERILVWEDHNPDTGEVVAVPITGGIEFSETGEQALVRELLEEIGGTARRIHYLGLLEEIFDWGGQRRHEVFLVYDVALTEPSLYEADEVSIVEPDGTIYAARWRSLADFTASARLVPDGLLDLIPKKHAS